MDEESTDAVVDSVDALIIDGSKVRSYARSMRKLLQSDDSRYLQILPVSKTFHRFIINESSNDDEPVTVMDGVKCRLFTHGDLKRVGIRLGDIRQVCFVANRDHEDLSVEISSFTVKLDGAEIRINLD